MNKKAFLGAALLASFLENKFGFDPQATRRSRSRARKTGGAFGCSAFNRAKKKADAARLAETAK